MKSYLCSCLKKTCYILSFTLRRFALLQVFFLILKNAYARALSKSRCILSRNWPVTGIIWDKIFKSELGKFCGRQPLKNLKGYSLLSLQILKGCVPYNLLSPLLNTLSHLDLTFWFSEFLNSEFSLLRELLVIFLLRHIIHFVHLHIHYSFYSKPRKSAHILSYDNFAKVTHSWFQYALDIFRIIVRRSLGTLIWNLLLVAQQIPSLIIKFQIFFFSISTMHTRSNTMQVVIGGFSRYTSFLLSLFQNMIYKDSTY